MFLGMGEKQNRNFETYMCVSHSGVRACVSILNYQLTNGLISPENVKWAEEKGYIKYGSFDCSERFIGAMSDTIPGQGNTAEKVGDTIRHCGLVPESLCPYIGDPTCFDKLKNGDEKGVDCGGSCAAFCKDTTIDLNVVWQRYFLVSEGNYNAMAYVENKNSDAAAVNLPYEFKLLDENNVVLDERQGVLNIGPKEIVPIIQNNFDTGKRIPKRVDFNFLSEPKWEKQNPRQSNLVFKDETIDDEEKRFTRIKAVVFNNSYEELSKIKLVVLIYDQNGNAIASSSTIVPKLSSNESQNIVFTWPTYFNDEISKFEIIPVYE
jgi:hypothetical protein